MLIDSHCHLNLLEFKELYNNLDEVLEDCKLSNIIHLLCVSIDLKAFPELLNISKLYNNISISAGVHPNEYDIDLNNLYRDLLKQAENQQVVAIGETGLDYYRINHINNNFDYNKIKNSQIDKFVTHIEIAKKLSKPLIIHTRDAAGDTINTLKNYNAREARGVMHCFTESKEVAKKALDLDFYISLSGIVTFKNATQVHEVAKYVPLDRLLVETDCPYLAPVPKRGKPNYPHYVKYTAEYLAELRGISFENLANETTENFKNLFKIDIID